MSSLNKSTFFRAFLSYLPLIILFISVFNEFDFNYLKIDNFSFNIVYIIIFYFLILKIYLLFFLVLNFLILILYLYNFQINLYDF